ncbi:MAG: hypothetical protein HLUCCA01_00045 [Bacteroidetes bacterium HLUCCA01]|nr:MAG: hypothetical protein HLUCCA01_00045 [Bacteroidetes bacterium HLUCCA01]
MIGNNIELAELQIEVNVTIEYMLKVKSRLDKLESEADWLTVREFAHLAGIKSKTVSNYCSKGLIKQCKMIKGIYHIHRSELNKRNLQMKRF